MDLPMSARLEDLAERRELARSAGSPRAPEDDSFQELDMLARQRAHGMGLEENRPYTDGVITGFGTIDARRVCVFSQDFTVFGGALGEGFAAEIQQVVDRPH